jgi:hypothetical protein
MCVRTMHAKLPRLFPLALNSCLVTEYALAVDLTPQRAIDSIESVIIGSM